MTWTTPKTWVTNEPLTASDLNTHLRDNLNALKAPPTDVHTLNEASEFSTTSTSFVDVDATNLALTITTTGGDVLIGFSGTIYGTGGTLPYVLFDIDIDGARLMGDDGILAHRIESTTSTYSIGFIILKQGLSAGSHTFKLQWAVTAGTGGLSAGSGGSIDVHPQFWVREV